jgi:3-oxoacyl-[acyl-carrier-protein] synthase-3
LTGLGHFFPKTILDNRFFDALDIGSSADWIDERVGIRERRSVLAPDDIVKLRRGLVTRAELYAAGKIMKIGEMCREPWRLALERSQAAARSVAVDQVICGTSVPDWDIPANACAVAGALGLECAAMDVNSACSSFVIDLHVARSLLTSGHAKTVAVFNPERYTTRLDFTDRTSCVLFGDAATAALLESAPGAQGLEILDTVVRSAPSGHEHVRIPDGQCFSQNGHAVQKFAVTKTVAIFNELLERNGLSPAGVSYFVGHQANYRMLTSACQKNGLSDEQHLYNVDRYGNQGAAGAPSVLSMNWDRFRPGDHIAVAVVGSGLSWGAALLRRT